MRGTRLAQKHQQKAVTAFFPPSAASHADTASAAILDPQRRKKTTPERHMANKSPDQAPATAAQIKEMLSEMKHTLQSDIKQLSTDLSKEIRDLGDRTAQLEEKMGEFTEAHNDLADSYNTTQKELDRLTEKVTDLEDRSRRNNIRLRGISESVLPRDLESHITDLLKVIMPDLHALERAIDQIHRVPKPRAAPDNVPRDVLARFVFYQTKDKLLSLARKKDNWPKQYQHLEIYMDLAPATLIKRKAFAETTKILRHNSIPYRWGYPVKLIVQRNGTYTTFSAAEDAKKALVRWDLAPANTKETPPRRQSPPATPKKLQREWRKT